MFELKKEFRLTDYKYRVPNETTTSYNSPDVQQKCLWYCVRMFELYGVETFESELKKKFNSWPANILNEVTRLKAGVFPITTIKEPIKIKKNPSLIAVTSIAPFHNAGEQQQIAIASWLKLGLKIYSLNVKSEIDILKAKYPDVNFIETTETGYAIFIKPYIKINALIDFGASHKSDLFMLINSDIILDYNPELLNKIKQEAQKSFVYLIRHDYTNSFADGIKQAWGIDAFVFNKSNCNIFTKQNYCLGQPWFDNWIPDRITQAKIKATEFVTPFLYHKRHKEQWSKKNWETCAVWFNQEACNSRMKPYEFGEMCRKSRDEIEKYSIKL